MSRNKEVSMNIIGQTLSKIPVDRINGAMEAVNNSVIQYLQKTRHISEQEAIKMFSTTLTCEALNDKNTLLFCESTAYVQNMLEQELSGNWDKWMV